MMDPHEAPTMRSRARLGIVLREKWRIDQLLGVGGMATVYAATHCNNGKRVAIKVLHAELSMIPEVRSRFLREGYVANKVSHPAIVSILDDDVAEDGSVFLVMELLEGETVESLRERSGNFVPVNKVAQIADQLLDVLAVAHEAGIVHRDIKPENLFLTHEGVIKVLDFGIARLRELQSAKITQTGAATMGTPAFMPPEQARGRSELVSPRTDIWAVGATMFTLASGRLVHDAETVNELLLSAMTRPAPPLLSVLPRFPPPIAAVIDRALAYEQSARWPNARAMQTALRQAAASIGIVLQELGAISAFMPLSALTGPAAQGGPLELSRQGTAPSPDAVPDDNVATKIVPAPPADGAAPALGAPVNARPPVMVTAPAVTMGANGLLSPRGVLHSKWVIGAAGFLFVLSAAGAWWSLRSSSSTAPAQADAPSASVTASAAPLPPGPAVTVEPAPPGAPSVAPVLPAPPPVHQSVGSAAPSAPLPSAKPVAQPPSKGTGTSAKGPASTPSSAPKKNILDRRN
jgi:eukaryotic-like serine/threonine-protein kinase